MIRKSILLKIANKAISELNAGKLLLKEITNLQLDKKLILISIGKAAWEMAEAAVKELGDKIEKGFVITKYDHSQGEIKHCKIFEAGHPLPDENSLKATETILKEVEDIPEDYEILFLISGGGSSLFEKPLKGITLSELIELNKQLINSGATINEINTVRKQISAVKGGRFAKLVAPRIIHTYILSDVIGDDVSMISSGPTFADQSTSKQALEIVFKYNINISEKIKEAIQRESLKSYNNKDHRIIGNIELLCNKAADIAKKMGYKSKIIRSDFKEDVGHVSEVIWKAIQTEIEHYDKESKPVILIFGGEPVIKISGNGKGGRNQHLALLMAKKISGLKGVSFLSFASDGTDGPTDAAGGIVYENTLQKIKDNKIDFDKEIEACNSYFVLSKINALIETGPTGTNVNDLMLILINPQ